MCWAEGKMSSASGPWGCRFLLNLFNRDCNLNKRKEYLKICMMPWFPIKDRGVAGMNCRQGQQHCIIFPGIFWLQLKHVSGFLLLFGGFFLHRTHKAERIWPLPALFTPFPGYPACSLPSTTQSSFLFFLLPELPPKVGLVHRLCPLLGRPPVLPPVPPSFLLPLYIPIVLSS